MSNQTQPETRKPLPTGRIALIAALLGAVVFVCVNIVSAQVFRNVFDTLTVRYDPVNRLVSGYYNDQFIGSIPYTATPVSFVGFEGEGTVDNFVVKASN